MLINDYARLGGGLARGRCKGYGFHGRGYAYLCARERKNCAWAGGRRVRYACAALAGALPLVHKNPFDRMIIAQAKIEGVKVVTPDAVYGEYGVGVVW